MTILYVIAHSIDPHQLSTNSAKFKNALKIIFSSGKFYVYLDEPRPWDNSYFSAQRFQEQHKQMKHLLGDICDVERLSVHKFIGKKSETTFSTTDVDDEL